MNEYKYITIMDAFKPDVVTVEATDKSYDDIKDEILRGIMGVIGKYIGHKPKFDEYILQIVNERLVNEFLQTDDIIIMMPFIPVDTHGSPCTFNFRIKKYN